MPRVRLRVSFAHVFNKATPILALLVILANVYRRFVIDAGDPYKCNALLNAGQWLDSPDRKPDHKPFLNWQPEGCLLHEYNAREIAACSEDGKILFVGDALTRQVFWATARKIEGNSKWTWEEKLKPDTHNDIEYEAEGVKLEFLWDPWLNSSALHEELGAFRQWRDGDRYTQHESTGTEERINATDRRPVVILVGGGLWHARYYKTDAVPRFRHSLGSIVSTAYGNEPPVDLRHMSASGDDGIGDEIFFMPLLEPLYDKLSPSREATIAPSTINALNGYLQEQSSTHGINVLWSFVNMTKSHPETYQESGLHVIESVAGRMADTMLNLRCNAKAATKNEHPHNRTCCSAYKPTKWMQTLGIFCAILFFVIVTIGNTIRSSATPGTNRPSTSEAARSTDKTEDKSATPIKPSYIGSEKWTSMPAALVLLVCACCCFLTDSTQVFDKFPKQFSNLDFRFLLGIVVLGCLLNIESVPANLEGRHPSTAASPRDAPFLPRTQSDEFKGWMQVYALIYGYTGSSSVLDFYEVWRVFEAFYMFLSGYGHAMYFLQHQDYSLTRVASVLLRLNMLPVILSFMMDRPYSTYYFAPLISFWFLVVYLTLKPRSYSNGYFRLLLVKIAISALVVTCFIHMPGFLDFSFTVLRYTCRAELNLDEWRHHLGINKYIVCFGMIVAAIHIRIRSILHMPQARLHGASLLIHSYFNTLRRIAVGLALVTVPTFWILTRRSHNKEDYDWWMPYISWLPVVSFVVLRNATKFLRSYYCASFAWLGHMSLELYLLSHHIWLAGDGYGLLRAGFRGDGTFFNDRWRDLVILTPMLVWAAGNAQAATATVIMWILNTGARDKLTITPYGSAKREPDALDHGTVLPKPASSVNRKHDLDGRSQEVGLSKDARRKLLTIIVVIWLGSLLY